MPRFLPGLTLNKLFYQQKIKPILSSEFPRLRHSAALIGWGSEVLGFDTPISRDHHWGPRALLFLSEKDYPKLKERVTRALAHQLPYQFMGYSTNYSTPEPNGVRHPIKITRGAVNHMVSVFTLRSLVKARLGFDPKKPITVSDWFPKDWLPVYKDRRLESTQGDQIMLQGKPYPKGLSM